MTQFQFDLTDKCGGGRVAPSNDQLSMSQRHFGGEFAVPAGQDIVQNAIATAGLGEMPPWLTVETVALMQAWTGATEADLLGLAVSTMIHIRPNKTAGFTQNFSRAADHAAMAFAQVLILFATDDTGAGLGAPMPGALFSFGGAQFGNPIRFGDTQPNAELQIGVDENEPVSVSVSTTCTIALTVYSLWRMIA